MLSRPSPLSISRNTIEYFDAENIHRSNLLQYFTSTTLSLSHSCDTQFALILTQAIKLTSPSIITPNPSTIGISLFFPLPLGVEVAATPLEVLDALLVDALEPAVPVDADVDVDVVVGIVVPALKPGSELVLEPDTEVTLDTGIEVTLPLDPRVIVVKTPPCKAAGAEALTTVFDAWAM